MCLSDLFLGDGFMLSIFVHFLIFLANCINLYFYLYNFYILKTAKEDEICYLPNLVGILCYIALRILSLSSCYFVSTELEEWVMYIVGGFKFDLTLVQFSFS